MTEKKTKEGYILTTDPKEACENYGSEEGHGVAAFCDGKCLENIEKQAREKMANRMEKLLIQHEEKIRQKSPNGDNPEYSKLKSYVLNRFSVLMKEIERMRQ